MKDAYNPKGGLLYLASNKWRTSRATKGLEKQFADFKSFYLDTQFREIYGDLYHAYRRGDLVYLRRSLSDHLYDYTR